MSLFGKILEGNARKTFFRACFGLVLDVPIGKNAFLDAPGRKNMRTKKSRTRAPRASTFKFSNLSYRAGERAPRAPSREETAFFVHVRVCLRVFLVRKFAQIIFGARETIFGSRTSPKSIENNNQKKSLYGVHPIGRLFISRKVSLWGSP